MPQNQAIHEQQQQHEQQQRERSGASSEQQSQEEMPTPERILGTISAYQSSAALKAGIELGLFTASAEGNKSVPEIARRCGNASERGVRILCDYLTVTGFLTKIGEQYDLAPDAAAFLN